MCSVRNVSNAQERDIAKLVNGRLQSNSGGTTFGGGDVHTSSMLIEAKTATKDQLSFSIRKEWLEKARTQAFEQNKYHYALAFRFSPDGEDYFIVNSKLFSQLVNYLEE